MHKMVPASRDTRKSLIALSDLQYGYKAVMLKVEITVRDFQTDVILPMSN